MDKVCFKSMLLGAAIVFITILVMGATVVNTNVNGRYQITSHNYDYASRVFVIDTQTGEVRSIEIENPVHPKGYNHYSGIDNKKVYTSGPWTE